MIVLTNISSFYVTLCRISGNIFFVEVIRVYISSFWDKPYQNTEMASLFDKEREDLLKDLFALPKYNTIRKINELVKRARTAKGKKNDISGIFWHFWHYFFGCLLGMKFMPIWYLISKNWCLQFLEKIQRKMRFLAI